ncbi:MAG: response regulator transcription factor [Betaproteobacteria bacterium]
MIDAWASGLFIRPVETAADGDEGLRLQAARPADLVITDIFMPNRDGIETISRLRVEYPRTKILVISGGGQRVRGADYMVAAREAGAHAVLRKPIERLSLLETVRGLVQ